MSLDPATPPVSLADQLKCAKRELKMRRSAYPAWVARGRMTQAKADHELAAQAALVATVEALLAGSRLL